MRLGPKSIYGGEKEFLPLILFGLRITPCRPEAHETFLAFEAPISSYRVCRGVQPREFDQHGRRGDLHRRGARQLLARFRHRDGQRAMAQEPADWRARPRLSRTCRIGPGGNMPPVRRAGMPIWSRHGATAWWHSPCRTSARVVSASRAGGDRLLDGRHDLADPTASDHRLRRAGLRRH